MAENLVLLAGSKALGMIRDGGLTPDRVGVVAGAAGGPKWLVLYHLDRQLFGAFFRPRPRPLWLLGASSGAWRFAALAQNDPLAALERFFRAYVHQTYATVPSPAEVSAEAGRILAAFVPPDGGGLLEHPWIRTGFLAVRTRPPLSGHHRLVRMAGLAMAAAANLADRRLLGLFMQRSLFCDPRAPLPLGHESGLPLRRIGLSAGNLHAALLASGSIPLVMESVSGIAGAPPGVYLDGGMSDYHLALPYALETDQLVLMPHYTHRVVPGWLDKRLTWRHNRGRGLDRLLLVAPSLAFVRRLPGGRIPDRVDFKTYFGRDRERMGIWKRAAEACRCLADEFMELVASDRIRERVRPLVPGRTG